MIANSINENLAAQLLAVTKEGKDFIDLSAKLYYKTTYEDGTICDQFKTPRKTQVVYYCD